MDIREPLFYLLAEEKLPLLDMHISTKSLEDIFLELTDSEKRSAAEEMEAKHSMEKPQAKKKFNFGRKKEEQKNEQEVTDDDSDL